VNVPEPIAVAVALLYDPSRDGHLRETLLELGTAIVYEAAAEALDRDALARSSANVVVVNLDDEDAPGIDEVYELLDDERYRVVFNDGGVSRALTGWDQARWRRHLAAKVLGADIDPPRPADAEPVPVRAAPASETRAPDAIEPVDVQEPAAASPSAEPFVSGNDDTPAIAAAPLEAAAPAAETTPVVPAVPDAAEGFDLSDLDALLELAASAPAVPASPTALEAPPVGLEDMAADDSDLEQLLASFGDDAALPGSMPSPVAEDTDADADSGDLVPDMPEAVETARADTLEAAEPLEADLLLSGLDFDAPGLFEAEPDPGEAASGVADIDPELLDLDSVAADDDTFAAAGNDDLALELAALDLDDHSAEAPPAMGDGDHATPEAPPAPPAAAGGAPRAVAAPDSWTLEDIEDLEAPPAAATPAPPKAPAPAAAAAFGIEKVRPEEFLAPPAATAAPTLPALDGLSLELIPLDEAVAPAPVESAAQESWLVAGGAAKAKVRRVWVLGASIGGPESLREFLSAFPRDYPALFLLAQHLGGEFVDMMARQLARATELTVRTPTHGERVGHGEVVIVPASQRLLVDAQGVVVLERNVAEGAYSPSIDRVIEDAADRFGAEAGAIIFSGMSDDAAAGCRYLAGKGGQVYVQEPDSCVVSTMVEGVRDTGVVAFTGTPAELAAKLLAETE
jgi:two-component system chemotaxis response regulator CheB/chemosensory pili system protein ChpB (putative protein-glutamate methylesterase)